MATFQINNNGIFLLAFFKIKIDINIFVWSYNTFYESMLSSHKSQRCLIVTVATS